MEGISTSHNSNRTETSNLNNFNQDQYCAYKDQLILLTLKTKCILGRHILRCRNYKGTTFLCFFNILIEGVVC